MTTLDKNQNIYNLWVEFKEFFDDVLGYFYQENAIKFDELTVGQYLDWANSYEKNLKNARTANPDLKHEIDDIFEKVVNFKIKISTMHKTISKSSTRLDPTIFASTIKNMRSCICTAKYIDDKLKNYAFNLEGKDELIKKIYDTAKEKLLFIYPYYNNVILPLSKIITRRCDEQEDVKAILEKANNFYNEINEYDMVLSRNADKNQPYRINEGDILKEYLKLRDAFMDVPKAVRSTNEKIKECCQNGDNNLEEHYKSLSECVYDCLIELPESN